MIEARVAGRQLRLFLVGCMLTGGFVAGALLLQRGNFSAAIAVFAIGLAALVGAGKLASP